MDGVFIDILCRAVRELRLNCSRLALLTVLRSWPGILHFCGPRDQTGFRAVVEVLYLNQLEIRVTYLGKLSQNETHNNSQL